MGMRWDARGTIALLVSALVGVTAGVVVGFTTGSPGAATAGPRRPDVQPERVRLARRPAGPRRPAREPRLHRRDDPGRRLGRDQRRPRATRSRPTSTAGVKYLETAESCNTLYGAGEAGPRPSTSSTSGPSTSSAEPCSLRMSVDHKGDVVTSLKPGVKIHVQCLCVLRPGDLPRRSPSAWTPTPATASTSAPSSGCWSTSAGTPTSPRHRRTTTRRRATIDPAAAGAQRHRRPTLPASWRQLTWQMLRDRRLRSSLRLLEPSQQVVDVGLAGLDQLEDPDRPGGRVDGERDVVGDLGALARCGRAAGRAAPRAAARAGRAARTGRRRPARRPGRPWPARGGTGRPRPRTCTTPGARRRRAAARRRPPRRARPARAGGRRRAAPAAARPRPRPPRRTPSDRPRRARAASCWSTRARRRPRPRRGSGRRRP